MDVLQALYNFICTIKSDEFNWKNLNDFLSAYPNAKGKIQKSDVVGRGKLFCLEWEPNIKPIGGVRIISNKIIVDINSYLLKNYNMNNFLPENLFSNFYKEYSYSFQCINKSFIEKYCKVYNIYWYNQNNMNGVFWKKHTNINITTFEEWTNNNNTKNVISSNKISNTVSTTINNNNNNNNSNNSNLMNKISNNSVPEKGPKYWLQRTYINNLNDCKNIVEKLLNCSVVALDICGARGKNGKIF